MDGNAKMAAGGCLHRLTIREGPFQFRLERRTTCGGAKTSSIGGNDRS